MKRAGFAVVGIVFLAGAVRGRAETISFKNGDQLTGDLERIVAGKLILKSDELGEVAVPLDKVESFRSDQPVVVLFSTGVTLQGEISINGTDTWAVKSGDSISDVAAKDVMAVFPEKVFARLNPERRNRPWQSWKGAGNLGYSFEHGDTRSETLLASIDATRLQPFLPGVPERWRTHYSLSTLFATTSTLVGPAPRANSVSSSLRQDYLFGTDDFVFVLGQLDHLDAQSLVLRQTYGAGLGRDLYRHSSFSLSFLGGATYVREQFRDHIGRDGIDTLIGERVDWHVFPKLVLSHQLQFYPSVSDTGRFRFDTTTSLSTPINHVLALQTGVVDHYLSEPLAGHLRNDVIMTMGLGIHF